MFTYDKNRLVRCIIEIIHESISPQAIRWLNDKGKLIRDKKDLVQFNVAFAAVPRQTEKGIIKVAENKEMEILEIRPGFSVLGWTADRLCRIWLILQLDPSEKEKYIRTIEQLFTVAEMNEQVALYSALPLFAYPELWKKRCAEGIRSNIGVVLEAIMLDNPYPSEQLDDRAWNQMVLKAIFTEKPLHRIVGLDKRANQDLANTLSDYAHERWAAHRPVHPLLWRCVGKFINSKIFPDIEKISVSENALERQAAALASAESNYLPAKDLLERNTELKEMLENNRITWNTLARKLEALKSEKE